MRFLTSLMHRATFADILIKCAAALQWSTWHSFDEKEAVAQVPVMRKKTMTSKEMVYHWRQSSQLSYTFQVSVQSRTRVELNWVIVSRWLGRWLIHSCASLIKWPGILLPWFFAVLLLLHDLDFRLPIGEVLCLWVVFVLGKSQVTVPGKIHFRWRTVVSKCRVGRGKRKKWHAKRSCRFDTEEKVICKVMPHVPSFLGRWHSSLEDPSHLQKRHMWLLVALPSTFPSSLSQLPHDSNPATNWHAFIPSPLPCDKGGQPFEPTSGLQPRPWFLQTAMVLRGSGAVVELFRCVRVVMVLVKNSFATCFWVLSRKGRIGDDEEVNGNRRKTQSVQARMKRWRFFSTVTPRVFDVDEQTTQNLSSWHVITDATQCKMCHHQAIPGHAYCTWGKEYPGASDEVKEHVF